MTRARRRWWLVVGAGAITMLVVASGTWAQSAPSAVPSAAARASASASVSAAPTADAGAPEPAPAEEPEAVRALRDQAQQIRNLLAKTLDLGVDPLTLFDIDVTDDPAVAVEARRLAAVIERAKQDAQEEEAAATAATADAGAPAPPAPSAKPVASAAASAVPEAVPEPPGIDYQALRRTDPARWAARIELDEARLAFYTLDPKQRAELLAAHAERQKEDTKAKAEREVSDAERKADDAEKERQKVLEAARNARSEAVRMAIEEHARLLGVAKDQARIEAELVKQELAFKEAQERSLALQRRVREAVDGAEALKAEPAEVDALYDEVRSVLRETRAALAESIAELSTGDSAVPGPGPDRLTALPAEVDRSAADRVRKEVLAAADKLGARELQLRRDRAAARYADVEALGHSRLSLVPHLSGTKRAAVTGFGTEGLDQAAAEGRHTWLVLRYHLLATRGWLSALREPGSTRGQSAIAATVLAFKWLFPLALFIWWRRRAQSTLEGLVDRLREADKKAGIRHAGPSRTERAVRYVQRVRKPLEWLLLLLAVVWLLPAEAQGLLEVELVTTIFSWTLGGTLVVQTIDYWAGRHESAHRLRTSQLQTAHIRLRSLGLIGRVVVTFGLILALSDKLVGEGTIYTWVFRLCWFAAIPVFLVVLRWWRDAIFERVDLKRKKTPVDRWVVDNRQGWKSFPAAVLGATTLFAAGALRMARSWVSTFDVTRRVLAYLFRRGMSKKAEEHGTIEYRRLDNETFQTLGPGTPSETIVPSVADQQIDDVINRINAPGGGIFAMVGERGAGKTTLLERIAETAKEVFVVPCPFGEMDAFTRRFREALEADDEATLEQLAANFDAEERDAGILIDDAHRLVLPMMGGLEAFDRLLAIARNHSRRVTWVFAFDDMIWRFLERMRGARPVFDAVIRIQPWREEAIVNLLTERCKEAGVEPSFERLVGELPADADDIDRAEALQQTEASYYRLIWDYASGNPGVALHVWRTSLGVSADGEMSVKLFQAPDTHELEQLPDPAVFVLRAIVQLESADADAIGRATRLSVAEVQNALRYGMVRGYFRRRGATYQITWAWFRAITRFLQRRHLLFASR